VRPDVPSLPGLLTAAQVADTAATIAAVQEPSGAIPWFTGGHVDPWDHIECAMALTAAGRIEEARRAYAWLHSTQRANGSWPARVRAGVVEDAGGETNQCGYLAVGLWHYRQVTGDEALVRQLWPTLRRAVDYVVDLQGPGGEIGWRRDEAGDPVSDALLTGCSSLHQSLRAAVAVSRLVGEERPDWELAAGLLAHTVAEHPEAFLDKSLFSMDWYYPVLGGVVRGPAGRARIDGRWSEFVYPDLGARCVADRPWVTGAETCELALAVDALGQADRARDLLASMQHLRADDGSYWTGYVVDNDVRWPAEQSTWTAAAVILAVDALSGTTPGSGVFRANDLPEPIRIESDSCGCSRRSADAVGNPAEHP